MIKKKFHFAQVVMDGYDVVLNGKSEDIDMIIKKLEKYDEIMAKRKQASEKSKASLMKNMTAEERKARALKAIQTRWKKNTTRS